MPRDPMYGAKDPQLKAFSEHAQWKRKMLWRLLCTIIALLVIMAYVVTTSTSTSASTMGDGVAKKWWSVFTNTTNR